MIYRYLYYVRSIDNIPFYKVFFEAVQVLRFYRAQN